MIAVRLLAVVICFALLLYYPMFFFASRAPTAPCSPSTAASTSIPARPAPSTTTTSPSSPASAANAATSNNNNGAPVFAGGSLPQGTTLQKLLFGTMTVVDDELTEAPELGSAAVGRAQGFYVASSEEGVSQTVAVTAMFKEGELADTISFFGVHRMSEGFAKVAVVRPGGVAASGATHETVLQFTVFLMY